MATEVAIRKLYTELKAGDRVEITHGVKVGNKSWTSVTRGIVVRTERRRHGLHFRRNADDKVYSDVIVLDRGDGELTTITVDEFTNIKRV